MHKFPSNGAWSLRTALLQVSQDLREILFGSVVNLEKLRQFLYCEKKEYFV